MRHSVLWSFVMAVALVWGRTELVGAELPTTISIALTSNGATVSPGQTVSGVLRASVTIQHGIAKHVQTYGNFITMPFIEGGHAPDTDVWTHTTDIDTRRFYDGENLVSVHAHPHNSDPAQPYTTDFTFATFKIVTANGNPSPNGDFHLPTVTPAAGGPTIGWYGDQGTVITGDATISDDTGANQQVDQSPNGSPFQIIAHLGDSVMGRFRWSGLKPPFGQFELYSHVSLRPFMQAQPFTARIIMFACNATGRANYAVQSFTMPAASADDRAAMPLPTLDAKIIGVGNGGTIRVPDSGSYPLQVQISNPYPMSSQYPEMTTWVGNHAVALTKLLPYLDDLPPGATSFMVTVPIPGSEIAAIQAAHAGGEAATAFALWNDFNLNVFPCLPASNHIHLNSIRTTSYPFPYGAPTVVIDSPLASSSFIGSTVALRYSAYGTPVYRRASIQLDAAAPIIDTTLSGTWTFTGVARGPHTVRVQLLDANNAIIPDPSALAVCTFAIANDPTRPVSDSYTAVAGTTLSVPVATGVLANDIDLEGDVQTAILLKRPTHGVVTLNADGSFTYRSTSHYEGVDYFSYQVSDGFALSRTASVTITVTNAAVPGSLVGDWITVGRDATHAGYAKGRLGARVAVTEWTRNMTMPNQTIGLGSVVVAGSRVYGVAGTNNNRAEQAFALDAVTGTTEWTTRLAVGGSISPACLTNGTMVFPWIDQDEQGHLTALGTNGGVQKWDHLFTTQWTGFQSPTPAAGNVYFESGNNSGLEAVSAATGARLFFTPLEQFQNWAPPYLNGHLYTFSANRFRDHDPVTGAVRASLDYGTNSGNGFLNGINPIVQGNFAYVVCPGVGGDLPALHAITLSTMTTAWTVLEQVTAPLSVGNGIVYAAMGYTLKAYDGTTGALKATFAASTDSPLNQPIITDDVVILSSKLRTWILDRTTLAVKSILPVGGLSALSNNALYLVDGEGATITRIGFVPPAGPTSAAQAVSLAQDTATTITLAGTATTPAFVILGNPSHGSLTGSGATRTYTPTAGYSGPDQFSYYVTDGSQDSAVALVSISVVPGNHAPVASSQTIAGFLGAPRTVTLTATDSDNDLLTYQIVAAPAHGTLTGTAPNLTYTPSPTFSGSDLFTFTARDAALTSTPATVTITIIAFVAKVNFQPAAAPVPAGYVVDSGLTYGPRNGFTYGWNAVNDNTRDREAGTSPDQRYDTLDHMQKAGAPNASWQIAVPNGTYAVHVVCGDAANFDSIFKLNIEAVLAVNGTPTSATRWIESPATLQVVVTDGKLTVSNATGAQNNKICFIDILQLPLGSG